MLSLLLWSCCVSKRETFLESLVFLCLFLWLFFLALTTLFFFEKKSWENLNSLPISSSILSIASCQFPCQLCSSSYSRDSVVIAFRVFSHLVLGSTLLFPLKRLSFLSVFVAKKALLFLMFCQLTSCPVGNDLGIELICSCQANNITSVFLFNSFQVFIFECNRTSRGSWVLTGGSLTLCSQLSWESSLV